jgi:hypothetical protein
MERAVERHLELGLDTFGDATLDEDGRPKTDAQVLRDVVCLRSLEKFYEARTPFGSIAATAVETRDIIKLRVYHLSFTTRPFRPKRYLHRLLGKAFTRETFVIYGVKRSLDLMPGILVPWRHVPRNESGRIVDRTNRSEAIDCASMTFVSENYSAAATTVSEDAKSWAPNGSHDISLGRPIEDAQADSSIIERIADISLARSQPSLSLDEPAHAKGSDRFDGNITIHDVLKGDYNIVANAGIIVPMPAKTCILDSYALETAVFAPPPWMCTLTSRHHNSSRTHGPGCTSPRPHGEPRAH